ncbi:hypothetical protein EDL79_01265 [Ehrlichia ruminantium]|uniref:Uncharacterized protein n=1 Tax=Ehrlichia ruminantium TaxID=779 RepID=A0AAE6QCT8_EHRRU|nr:hypothetical protein [Ehrlichia ruminantium]QGR02310.1 hypothetical protein EDL81_01265 [Ehrlichia ruminantium]QGR03230.1 hypothetical protein EDL80_01265 [Ehrlichia ruminantium]QGR04155.1 hypothetical protein EDL79_01265 [Ehrlichia ruminantium]
MFDLVLQFNKNTNHICLLTIWILITLLSTLVTICTILYLISFIHRKYLSKTHTKKIPADTQHIPGLSKSNLSKILSSADTTIQKTNSPHTGKLSLYINQQVIQDNAITQLNNYHQSTEDDIPIRKHIQYLETLPQVYNSYFCLSDRAILGASLEKIFSTSTKHTPDLKLIHHMINYTHTISYTNALSEILNNTVHNNSRYKLINTALRPQIKIIYNSETPNQFSIDVKFERSLITTGKKPKIYPITAEITFSISLSEDKNQTLQYSQGKVVLNLTKTSNSNIRSFLNIFYRSNKTISRAFHKTTLHQVSENLTKLIYPLPDFTIQNITPIEQSPQEIPTMYNTSISSNPEKSTRQH